MPLYGEEIGKLLAQALESGIAGAISSLYRGEHLGKWLIRLRHG